MFLITMNALAATYEGGGDKLYMILIGLVKFEFNSIMAGCHTPVEWHNWTGEKINSQIRAILDPAHLFLER